MKIFYLLVLTALCGANVRAQTNAPAAATNAAPPAPTRIDSESGSFDQNGHKVVYSGNVRVDDPDMKLRCEWLVVDLPEEGGRVSHIIAETNVVIDMADAKGQTMHATSQKAVYIFQVQDGVTNETVTLTGNPKPQVVNKQGTLDADVIIWDRANNEFQYVNPHTIFNMNFNGTPAATNSTTKKSSPKK